MSKKVKTISQAMNEIFKRAPEHKFTPTLDRIVKLMDLLGNPQLSYKTIHITGTNGKTSVTKLTEKIIDEYGLNVGAFISPHVSKINERITLNGTPISNERFVDIYNEIMPYVDLVDEEEKALGKPQVSFFELLTAMAFIAFADAPVDIAVIEVGMGGEFDSTNVIKPEATVFTHIDIDHENYLGRGIESITRTKAGIIKPGVPVCSEKQCLEVEEIIREEAEKKGASNLFVENDNCEVVYRQPAVGGQLVTFKTPKATYRDVYLKLFGEHQASNALMAVLACEEAVGDKNGISRDVLESAFANIRVPGRMDVIESDPVVIFDVSHNPDGARAMVKALKENFMFEEIVFVLAMMKDKDIDGYLDEISSLAGKVIVTTNSSERSIDENEFYEIALKHFDKQDVVAKYDLESAIDLAKNYAESRIDSFENNPYSVGIVIAGSVATGTDLHMLNMI